MKVTFRKGSARRTECYIVTINGTRFYISYTTVVALEGNGQGGYFGVRRVNKWGPTTGRHIREMGCFGFRCIDDDEFEAIMEELT